MDKNAKLNRCMDKFIVVLFFAIIFVLSVLCIQKFFGRTMNLYQNAKISELSQINAEIENEIKSSFPGLKYFQNIRGLLYRATGKIISENFGYIKDDDGVVRIISPIRDTRLRESITALSDVLKETGTPLVFVNLPDAGEDVTGNFSIDGERHTDVIEQLQENGIDILNIDTNSLNLQTNNITFHTDFHYTTEAEFKIADRVSTYIEEEYGVLFANRDEVFSLHNYTEAEYAFVGNTVRHLGEYYTSKDVFEIYHPNFETAMELVIGKDNELRIGDFSQVVLNGYETLLDYNQYTYWVTDFGQFPQELYTLTNDRNPSAAKILIICDSIFMRGFSYLSLCSGQVTIFDPRVDDNTSTMQVLLDEQNYDIVLVVGSCNGFFESSIRTDKLLAADSPLTLFVDTCNGKNQTEQQTVQIIPEATSYQLYGWAGDTVRGELLSALYVKAGDQIFRCNYGIDRQSVVDYFQNENLRYTGFSVTLPESAFADETVEQLQFIGVSQDGSCRYENYPYDVSYITLPSTVTSEDIPDQLSDTALTLFVDTCNDKNQTEQQTVQIAPGAASYQLYGWAGDTVHGETLSALYVKAGNQIFRCNYGIDRQSVVDYFQNENLRYTGFSVTLPESAFADGVVEQLQFIGVSQDGSCRYENYPYAISYVTETPADDPADDSAVNPADELAPQDNSPLPIILLLGAIVLLIAIFAFLWKKTSLGIKLEQHSFLFEELVKRDFTLKYKRTMLGALWSLLSPLINLLIMWLVFNKMLGSNIDHFVIYLFAGQLVFSYFSDATNMGMTSLLDNAAIFTKVNVPKYLFLFSRNVSSLINFSITLIVFFFFVLLEGIPFTWKFLMLVFPVLCLIVINLGVGMILSALYVFFRDMQYLWGLALQLIMWMSAIFYSIDGYAENVRKLFLLNPVYLCIRYFRKIVIENTVPTMQFHLLLAAMAVAFFSIGCWMYKHYKTKFLYYV